MGIVLTLRQQYSERTDERKNARTAQNNASDRITSAEA